MKTLIVGGGVTSSLIGFFLHNTPLSSTKIDIWEKENDIGGRMRTVYNKYSRIHIDLGAQYLTTTNSEKFNRKDTVYQSLLNHKVIKKLDVTIKNIRHIDEKNKSYVVPNGMSSLVQHFFNVSNCDVFLSHSLKSLNVNNQVIEAETTSGVKSHYDSVVLTMPIPEIQKLTGNFLHLIHPQTSENMTKVQFSSRYVLILIYEKQIEEEWAACYTPDDGIIKFVSIQEKKVGVHNDKSSVVVHSSVDMDQKFQLENNEQIQLMLIHHISNLFPHWGKPIDVFCHKWNYSQVTVPFSAPSKILTLNPKPLILIAGDSFGQSNFDTCVESAREAADILLKIELSS